MATMTLLPIRNPAPLDLTCNATATVTGQVRLLLDCRFPEWGLTAERHADLRADLHLIATELVTNAIQETPDRAIRAYCVPDLDAGVIHFAVWDSSDGRPEAHMPELTPQTLDLREENFDDNGGWGLPLVEALAERCGVTATEGGKWVWADIKVGLS
jgi:anti-sigma regulatory factor (Ser/Thr protein kinase)